MTWPTPERHQMEVLLTVCNAVVVGSLNRVATAHQIAPWSEDMTCLPSAVLSGAHPFGLCPTSRTLWQELCDANHMRALTTLWRVPACDWLVMAMATASRKLDTVARGAAAESH